MHSDSEFKFNIWGGLKFLLLTMHVHEKPAEIA